MAKIIQPGPNTVPAPTYYPTPEQMTAFMEGVAGEAALTNNRRLYADYLGKGSVSKNFGEWLAAYQTGDATEPPPAPPVQTVALMAEGGGFDLIPDPAGTPVGVVPTYPKVAIVKAPAGAFGTNPFASMGSAFDGAIGAVVTLSNGAKWMRIG